MAVSAFFCWSSMKGANKFTNSEICMQLLFPDYQSCKLPGVVKGLVIGETYRIWISKGLLKVFILCLLEEAQFFSTLIMDESTNI